MSLPENYVNYVKHISLHSINTIKQPANSSENTHTPFSKANFMLAQMPRNLQLIDEMSKKNSIRYSYMTFGKAQATSEDKFFYALPILFRDPECNDNYTAAIHFTIQTESFNEVIPMAEIIGILEKANDQKTPLTQEHNLSGKPDKRIETKIKIINLTDYVIDLYNDKSNALHFANSVKEVNKRYKIYSQKFAFAPLKITKIHDIDDPDSTIHSAQVLYRTDAHGNKEIYGIQSPDSHYKTEDIDSELFNPTEKLIAWVDMKIGAFEFKNVPLAFNVISFGT